MKKVLFNDQMGHRSLSHVNLVAVPSSHIFLRFIGETIPGICRVTLADYSKNGKWSANTWTCELADGVMSAVHSQDWNTGSYFNSQTWPGAIAEFLRLFPDLVGPEWEAAAERFIRSLYTKASNRLDEEAAKAVGAAPIAELIAAQTQLAAEQKAATAVKGEVRQLIAVREAEEQATELRRKTQSVIERLSAAKKMSLADLQELYRQL